MPVQAVAHGKAEHFAGNAAKAGGVAEFIKPGIHVAPVIHVLEADFLQRMAQALPFRGGGRVLAIMAGGGGQVLVGQAKIGLRLHHAAHEGTGITRSAMDRTMQHAQHFQQAAGLAAYTR
ncbi:hypothetical protein AA0616_2961 [Komagataeibacter nataicola NRIC 0616]|nr:hypothetical protein AA0616_2961 [Komagataeibacter nataicola NRIC 0616]